MTADEKKGLQEFIDKRIAPKMQEHYPLVVSAYKSGWEAALKWKSKKKKR